MVTVPKKAPKKKPRKTKAPDIQLARVLPDIPELQALMRSRNAEALARTVEAINAMTQRFQSTETVQVHTLNGPVLIADRDKALDEYCKITKAANAHTDMFLKLQPQNTLPGSSAGQTTITHTWWKGALSDKDFQAAVTNRPGRDMLPEKTLDGNPSNTLSSKLP